MEQDTAVTKGQLAGKSISKSRHEPDPTAVSPEPAMTEVPRAPSCMNRLHICLLKSERD